MPKLAVDTRIVNCITFQSPLGLYIEYTTKLMTIVWDWEMEIDRLTGTELPGMHIRYERSLNYQPWRLTGLDSCVVMHCILYGSERMDIGLCITHGLGFTGLSALHNMHFALCTRQEALGTSCIQIDVEYRHPIILAPINIQLLLPVPETTVH